MGLLALAALAFGAGYLGAGWIATALIVNFFGFRKRLLWSVRNRLLLTFLLAGVVPMVLFAGLVYLGAAMLLSQFTAERVSLGVKGRLAELSGAARDIATAASLGPDDTLIADALRLRVPRMAVVIGWNGRVTGLPQDGAMAAVPEGLPAEFEGLLRQGAAYFLAARAAGSARNADVFVYQPLDGPALASLTGGAVEVREIVAPDQDVNIRSRDIGPRQLPGPMGWYDSLLFGVVQWPLLNAAGGEPEVGLVVFSRPSLLLEGILKTQMAATYGRIFAFVGVLFLLAEAVALFFTVKLTWTVTRSVHALYNGTQQVALGDFTHSIPVRGAHQLSELAASFNGMSTKIQHFLGEMKKKEKIESELEIARQVQARLFPRTVPELRTLEMQGVYIPGRFISGDYYDFVKLGDRYTAIALGDVSGKGVSAALLMASIQASLHAQLSFAGEGNPVLSTATLMALIGQQLYESTPAEKYATFFCSVYDDETGVLRYTNAGHLQPILVREGKASSLPGDGMVVGLLPNVKYEQQEIQLLPGGLGRDIFGRDSGGGERGGGGVRGGSAGGVAGEECGGWVGCGD